MTSGGFISTTWAISWPHSKRRYRRQHRRAWNRSHEMPMSGEDTKVLIPFGNSARKNCDGITRRHALRIGASGLIGGLSLPWLLELQAKASSERPAPAQACIFIFLEGGPSHIDMWDLKPDQPAEIRGPFRPIATNVAGTRISEHLPLCAAMADKYTIVRSHSHTDNGHNTGYHYVMT